MSKISNININFDSLGWALQTNNDFEDPTFFLVADRFMELADKHDFKYTIFVIGKDLENPAVRKVVKEWYNLGHEIGNHSYYHRPDFGSLSYLELEADIWRSHNLIKKACQKDPVGFIAPGWATSKTLTKVLIEKGYKYDTSLFPSWFMYLAEAKFLWNFKNDERRFDLFRREDYIANLLGTSKPFFTNGESLYKNYENGRLLILPLPTTKYMKIPCWHTMKFMMPERLFTYSMNNTLRSEFFYYLIHPTDLMDLNDVPKEYQNKVKVLERIDVPYRKKLELMEKSILKIKKHSASMKTLSEISDKIIRGRK
jgi:peptidoglycan/xylan/chitin deacetylase (PgdA/CDA1 family)